MGLDTPYSPVCVCVVPVVCPQKLQLNWRASLGLAMPQARYPRVGNQLDIFLVSLSPLPPSYTAQYESILQMMLNSVTRLAHPLSKHLVRPLSTTTSSKSSTSPSYLPAALLLTATALLTTGYLNTPSKCDAHVPVYTGQDIGLGKTTADAPLMTAREMQAMSEDGKIVVMLDGNVYDITAFTGHPGGVGRLQMASGGDLAVYWKVYMQHNRGHIDKIMGKYQIGRLSEKDAKVITDQTYFANPYENDPPTSEHLLTNTRYPYNAEGRIKVSEP